MSENQQDPFENHINSESFDLSRLDNPIPPSEMDLEMEAFFDKLPLPLNHELWDSELDERQKMICAHLTTELVERIMRENHYELLQDLSDDQLIYILTVPVTLGMLAEQRLHLAKQAELVSAQAKFQQLNYSEASNPPNQSNLRHWFSQAKSFFMRLFRRE